MKFRKHISKLLALGILTNNIYFNSSANTEVPNRYQTLEGEYITMDDSTEGELHEIEIFGNTVQDENNLEDIQSVGDLYIDDKGNPILDSQGREQYKISISSVSKNVYDIKLRKGAYQVTTGVYGENFSDYICSENDKIPVLPNTKYSICVSSDTGAYISDLFLIDKENKVISKATNNSSFITTNNTKYIRFNMRGLGGISIDDVNLVHLEIGEFTGFFPSIRNEAVILLPTQLQKVGNVADRLYWDDNKNKYVIEKNITSVEFDGSDDEVWVLTRDDSYSSVYDHFRTVPHESGYPEGVPGHSLSLVSDKFICTNLSWVKGPHGSITTSSSKYTQIGMTFNRNYYQTVDDFKNWLRDNPTTVWYQLKTPEIIETNIASKLTIPIYDSKTYIYAETDSVAKPNLKIVVDRLKTIAKNNVTIAQGNPTTETLSNARYYVNQLEESTFKDQLQERLNNIFSVSDLTFDKQTVTANLDIYIKSENMLSMSLSTNSISFDNYSGVADMELKDAIELTVNSSLPYDINVTMPTKILNSDGSNEMDLNLFNIKESSEVAYHQFENTTDKVVLKTGCEKGNNKVHKIDLKLSSNQAHKADIYKTTLKLEVEQK